MEKTYKTSDILYNNKVVSNDFRYCENIIYLAIDNEGKKYVGETSTPFIQRIKSHLRKKGTDFELKINSKNMDNFHWTILENNLINKSKRFERERYFIEKYNSLDEGYNMTSGGGGTKDYKHSSESILKNKERRIKYFEDDKNRKKQSKASLIAHSINPNQAKEHSSIMKRKFDPSTKEGKKRRELTARNQREHYEKNRIEYVLNYKKPPFFAYENGKCIGIFISQAECSRMLKVNKSHLSQVLNGKRNSTGGYQFKYMEKTGYLINDLDIK
tara:strand:+ start:174 stop:989 length:816 start_codon:yes stop_codon:yes gene_type:complete